MFFRADTIQAEDLAGHLEAGDLLAAIFEQHIGLEEAGLDGVDRLEGVAAAIDMLAAQDAATQVDEFVKLPEFVIRQPHRQAEFAQVALRTGLP